MKRMKLKIARVTKGMTQKEVAEKIGMCQSRYSNIEKGKSNPTLEQATLLMKLLDVKVSIF